MQFSTLTQSLLFLISTTVALPNIIPLALPNENSLEVRAGKPTGGPASATITVYNSLACTSETTVPPTGSANTTVTIAELQCAIFNIPATAAITAVLTATPKTGTLGCYIQLFTQQGCGVVLGNNYIGFPFDGIGIGNKIGCVAPFGGSYGAIEIICD